MRHIEEERLVVLLCLIQCFGCFLCQCFGDEYIFAPVFIQSGDGKPRARFSIRTVTEVSFTEIACQTAASMSGDVYFKAEVIRVFARSIYCPPVGFTAMDGMIAVIFQYLGHRSNLVGMFDTRHFTDTVHVPVR